MWSLAYKQVFLHAIKLGLVTFKEMGAMIQVITIAESLWLAQIYYPDEKSGGDWWYGTITSDKLQGALALSEGEINGQTSQQKALWERFGIAWDPKARSFLIFSFYTAHRPAHFRTSHLELTTCSAF